MEEKKMEGNFKKYVTYFLDKLEIYEDIHNYKEYKKKISESIISFMNSPTDSAYSVYEAFFTAYWIGTQKKENPFLKLIENVKRFEELGGRLTLNQRDHFGFRCKKYLLGIY